MVFPRVGLALGMALLLALPAAAQIPTATVSTLSLSETLSGFGNIGGIVADAQGDLYVANFRDRVWRISPDGTVKLLTDALYGASGNAIDSRGDLYQSNFNANTVSRIRRTGEVETVVDEGLSGPVGLTFDPGGNLYVCNCSGGSISKVTPDGEVGLFAESPLLACPNGIVRDDRGDLYVVNFNNTKIVRIGPDGSVHEFADIPGAGGNGHLTYARGVFYVTKFRGHQIFRVDREGNALSVAGDGTREVLDGPVDAARFSYPNGITANRAGTVLYVNDLVGPYNTGEASTIAIRKIDLVTLGEALAAAVESGDGDALEVAYREFCDSRPWEDTSADAISQGYALLSSGRAALAITLFTLNAAGHPEHAASQFHLGECFRYTGQAERAAEQYRKALAIDPEHAQARARLELVSGS